MNKKQLIVAYVIGILIFFSCLLLTTNAYAVVNCFRENYGGFWSGLWDGLISPIKVFLSIFWNDLCVYNSNNNGFMYNLGFFIIAIPLLEITIPLFIFAWVIKILFFIVILLIGLIFRR